MFRNYLKIAWRNLFRNKGFSITNLLGLATGMTCTILILLWVRDELTFNRFHTNYDRIYQVIANRDFNNQVFTDRNMVLPLAQAIEDNVPQVKYASTVTYPEFHVLSYGETKLKQTGYSVSAHFFDMFTWQFIKGNPAGAIKDPSSIVLSRSAAKALFGTADPINKVVKIDNDQNYTVTAVVADAPDNSTFSFDYIRPFNYSDQYIKRSMEDWQNSSWRVYVQTVPGTDMHTLDKAINEIKQQHDPGDKKISTYFTFPMSKWRLYSDFKNGKNTGGMIEYVRLFTIVAWIILLIACVNFMNLSTARSEKRAKEVGIRKTLGSDKKRLVLQFFFESMILAVLAFVLSLLAVFLLLPSFNTLVNKHLSLDITEPLFWLGAVVIIILTGVVAGSYPALYLSSFNPIRVLKGTMLTGKKAVLPRQVLVVAQFAISILLISATIIIYRQIQHTRNRDIGYDPNNLVIVPTNPDAQKSFGVIKQALQETGMVNGVTRTLSPITEIWWKTPAPDWEGKPDNLNILFNGISTDVDFAKTMGIKIVEGKGFSGLPSDSSSMLLNKAAVKAMGIKNPIGMQMRQGRTYAVIGVTDNVVMESPFKPVDPLMVVYQPETTNFISIRLAASATPQRAIPAIEKVFKRYNAAYPFEYQFADQEFGKKFMAENLISKLSNLFAGLAIFICCLGLAGLASFTIEKRIREIGVRKVLGASVQQLLLLISREFVKLVLIAFLIAVPLSWWLMHDWLQKYEYRIHISGWLFGMVGLLILLLTVVVVGLNTLRAATANPVKSLRTE